MNTTELVDEKGNPITKRIISGEDEPLLESLHEKLFDFSKDELQEIRGIFESSPKSKLAIENPQTFNHFIEQLKALIRKYRAIKSRTSEVKSTSDLLAQVKDWIEHLSKSRKILISIDSNFEIVYLLQTIVNMEPVRCLNPANDSNVSNIQKTPIESELEILITRLNLILDMLNNRIKTGRPPVNDMRSWLIKELAQLYASSLGLKPSKTRGGVFNDLVNFVLEFVDDPLKDSFSAIRKALQSK